MNEEPRGGPERLDGCPHSPPRSSPTGGDGGNRPRSRCTLTHLFIVILVLGTAQVAANDTPLTIADLAEYHAALNGKAHDPPVAVGFRELWDHPETYRGRRVQVEGRIVRRFRQGAFGTFPPLEEVWVVTPADNPLCFVFPEKRGHAPPGPGDSVRFVGTFLKRVQYQGGDRPRLAPLIVGARPPVATAQAPPVAPSGRGLSAPDWLVGSVVAALVVLVLARQHLRHPVRRPWRVKIPEPPPDFVPPPSGENVSA
jgi:hypothetical protein